VDGVRPLKGEDWAVCAHLPEEERAALEDGDCGEGEEDGGAAPKGRGYKLPGEGAYRASGNVCDTGST